VPWDSQAKSRLLQWHATTDNQSMFSLIIATAAFAGVGALSVKYGADSRKDDGHHIW